MTFSEWIILHESQFTPGVIDAIINIIKKPSYQFPDTTTVQRELATHGFNIAHGNLSEKLYGLWRLRNNQPLMSVIANFKSQGITDEATVIAEMKKLGWRVRNWDIPTLFKLLDVPMKPQPRHGGGGAYPVFTDEIKTRILDLAHFGHSNSAIRRMLMQEFGAKAPSVGSISTFLRKNLTDEEQAARRGHRNRLQTQQQWTDPAQAEKLLRRGSGVGVTKMPTEIQDFIIELIRQDGLGTGRLMRAVQERFGWSVSNSSIRALAKRKLSSEEYEHWRGLYIGQQGRERLNNLIKYGKNREI